MAYKFSIGDTVFGAGDASWTGALSASGVSTLDKIVTNRLTTPILSASVSSVNIVVTGGMNFGTEAQTTVSLVGVLSSSATPTFNTVNADRLAGSLVTVTTLDATTLHGDGALLQNITAAAGPATSTSIYKRGDLETVLSGGMNYFTASTNPLNATLPTASYGDIVYVKAGPGVSNTNFIRITMSIAKSGELGNIDGAVEQLIESPYGSISLCYVEDFTWRIF